MNAVAATGSTPQLCYNCELKLELDFYWIVVSKQDRNKQWLGADLDDSDNDELYDWVEFEVYAHCFAAH